MLTLIEFRLRTGLMILALLLSVTLLIAQEPPAQKTNFYDVQITPDEIYSYTNLKFTGDFGSLESPTGMIALGRTEAGVTVAIVLGVGNYTIDSPDPAAQEKMKKVFEAFPLKGAFKTIYMRLHPKEFDATIGKMGLTKAQNEEAFKKAKEIFDVKFLGSYHAGPKALLPPEKTRVMEFDTDNYGQIYYEEGYWLKLRRLSPYGNIYPATFVNPKQK
jgi:hypothetical protein